MKANQYIRNLLLFLVAIYFAQGSLYTQGSLLSQSVLALLLVICVVYFCKSWFEIIEKSFFFKTWTILLLLNVIGFIFFGTVSNSLHLSMFKSIIIASLPFYPFYYFAQLEILKSKHLIAFFIVLLPLTILQFFLNANQILSDRLSDKTDLVNNIAYSFVALIPFVFLFKQKKILSTALMLVLMFFIIQGAKRGALIAGIIGLLSFIYFQLRTVEKSKLIRGYLFIIVVLLGLSYYACYVYQSNEFLVERMREIGEKGGSSGRDIIYANIFSGWFNSDSYLNLLLGFGFAASLELSGTGNYAHNDWLELLSNFGLLGVTVYGFHFYGVIANIRSVKFDIDKKLMLVTIVLIWFFTTLVSMSYTSNNSYVQAILLAYLIGSNSENLD